MRISIALDFLAFHEPVKAEVLEYVKAYDLKQVQKNGKIYVHGTKTQLYKMLFALSVNNDIDLM